MIESFLDEFELGMAFSRLSRTVFDADGGGATGAVVAAAAAGDGDTAAGVFADAFRADANTDVTTLGYGIVSNFLT